MNITQEKINDLNAVVKIKIAPEDYTEKVDKSIKEQAKKANLPGFRKGMVPAAHIKKMYGRSILVEEINNLLSETLNKHLTDNKVEILGQPLPVMDDTKEFKWDYTDEFEFDYELGLAPAIEVAITSKDKFTQYVVKADEETLAARIKNIRKSYGKMTNPEVSADDDVLYAELTQLSADGSVFEGGITATGSIRLDQVTDKKILKSLIGLKKDDVVELDVQKAFDKNEVVIAKLLNISEEDAKDLQSKFRVTVKNVNRLEEADLNQEFFDKLFGAGVVTDEAGFKTKITEEIESMFKQDADRKLQNDIYTKLIESVKMELPDEFLRKWLKATNEKLTDEELTEGYDDFAKNLKWTLIENKLIKDNNIEIKYEDVFQTAKQRLDAQFRMYSPSPMPEDQLAQYTATFLKEKDNANRIFDEVKAIKVFDYIQSVATLDQKEIAYNKFTELK
ncbi:MULTISPECIES: trigger factor [Pedobacter]|uniref:Trigger factor n=1 Tax=Pedobacter heparinus (strain ATCC 13125 / DSM 2366 / CIP 104194 / JCM 7457 / NBRC 12017 / NCIMB 9290 / NRRL B-14731 / HIM 762-3) TaxID=485917 RepID=C6Y354_PEDHD|nr:MULTISPECIES: trigger factor [Pedobacter]ACU05279.1 trigger factor [Pedobacter heparinus DSM 2366]MBB5439587.1 trigger factor [Pedobacter sp. AK017]